MRLCRIIPLVMVVLGCGHFRIDTSDIPKATKDITVAATELRKGLSEIDALGMKTLILQNQELRQALDALTAKTSDFTSGSGVVTFSDNSLRFEVQSYTGAFRVDAYVDTKANWIFKNVSYQRQDYALNLDIPVVGNARWNRILADVIRQHPAWNQNSLYEETDKLFSQTRNILFGEVEAARDAAFLLFLKNAPIVPLAQPATADLNLQGMSTGPHDIHVVITPVAANAAGVWAIRGRIFAVGANKSESLIKLFDESSSLPANAGHPLNTPLPEAIARITVQTGPGK